MDSVFKQQMEELALREPERKVAIEVDRLPPAMGDLGLVQQVTANLLGNAWKFTRQRQGATIRIRGSRNGAQSEYVVTDNGAGFDMKYADKLFGVFQRLHRPDEFEGTGVGLAVVHRIVERHGGRIWAEAEPGRGATFHFTLPAIEGAA
jgi:light-regulated signal transduction histidine kinase (bacteriophytochrome)